MSARVQFGVTPSGRAKLSSKAVLSTHRGCFPPGPLAADSCSFWISLTTDSLVCWHWESRGKSTLAGCQRCEWSFLIVPNAAGINLEVKSMFQWTKRMSLRQHGVCSLLYQISSDWYELFKTTFQLKKKKLQPLRFIFQITNYTIKSWTTQACGKTHSQWTKQLKLCPPIHHKTVHTTTTLLRCGNFRLHCGISVGLKIVRYYW